MFSDDCFYFLNEWGVRPSFESKDVVVDVGGLRKERCEIITKSGREKWREIIILKPLTLTRDQLVFPLSSRPES